MRPLSRARCVDAFFVANSSHSSGTKGTALAALHSINYEIPMGKQPDQYLKQVLTAVEGYCELGMLQAAWEEIETLPESIRITPVVLKAKTLVLLREEAWNQALDVSRELIERYPESSSGYIHAAYCLHEIGETEKAMEILENGPPSLQEEPVYYYNLSCYQARLGAIKDARKALMRSLEMDETLLKIARNDPDLKEFWNELGK